MPRSFLNSVLIGFCGGIILAEFWHPPVNLLVTAAAISSIGLNWRRGRLGMIFLLFFALGIFRLTSVAMPTVGSIAGYDSQTLRITGQIFELPETGDRQTVLLDKIMISEKEVNGKAQVYLPSWPQYQPGQELTVDCQITALTFARFPRQWSHGIQARCFSAKDVNVQPSPSSWRGHLGRVLNTVVHAIAKNFNQPQSSLLSGVILGSQGAMPAELRQAFQATGTTHIIALSGFNVTIIVTTIIQLLVRLFGRRWAWIPGLVVVVIFVIMTGASASVVRAAIMAVISQLGLFLGRPIAPGRLLSYVGIIMLWHNPMILLHDLGFQLSFLATVGLVFLSKPLAARLTFVPERFSLRESLSTTLAAIIMTEPLLLWRFGRLSLIAPLVNVLVLPLIPLSMGLGMLWLIGQFIHPMVGLIFQPVTDVVLRVALWVISTGAARPLSQVYLGGSVAGVTAAVFFIIAINIRRKNAEVSTS